MKEMVVALAHEAEREGHEVAIHLKIDTGMGCADIAPNEVVDLLDHFLGPSCLLVRM